MQAALPREMYVDEATWRAERDAVLFGEWFCVGRRDDLGLAEPSRVVGARRGGRVGARHQRRDRACCTRRTTSAATAAPSILAGRVRACAAAALALPLPLLDLRPRRPAAAGAARRPRRRPRSSRSTRSGSRPGVASSSCTSRRSGAPARGVGRPDGHHAGQLRPRGPRRRRDLHLRRGGQLQGAARELQRVLPLRPGAPRAVPAGAVVRRRRRRPGLGGGHPAPRGRLDLHDDGHHHPRSAARAGRRRAHPAQGRPRLPQPDALRLGRPRRRVRAAAPREPTAPRSCARCSSPPTRSSRPTSTRATPASCGTWSTGRTGRSASRCSAGCRRAATGTAGSRRWRTTASTSGAGCCPGWPAGWSAR